MKESYNNYPNVQGLERPRLHFISASLFDDASEVGSVWTQELFKTFTLHHAAGNINITAKDICFQFHDSYGRSLYKERARGRDSQSVSGERCPCAQLLSDDSTPLLWSAHRPLLFYILIIVRTRVLVLS